MYQIAFFNSKIEKEITQWPAGIRADFLKIIEIMMIHGSNLGEPKTKRIDKGLFEIRAKGKEGIGRALFCTVKDKKIIILHAFIKKTQKTPAREIKLAKKRMKEI